MNVETRFLPFYKGEQAPELSSVHDCVVQKVPRINEHRSAVNSGSGRPVGDFDSDDNFPREKDGHKQRTNVHEGGHFLGLDDEYIEGGGPPPANAAPKHAKLALEQLGVKVTYGKTDAIMSHGEQILPQHSVTMREALQQVAGPEAPHWELTPRAPSPDAGVDPQRLEPPPPATDPPV